jgi:transposase
MNPVSKLSPPVVPDPFLAEVIAQLKEQVSAQQRVISEKDARLATYAMHVQKLEEELRLERIKKYGKQSEKLSDLQLELLDREPAVASEEIATEAAAGPLPQPELEKDGEPARKRKPHPGRNPLPAHLKRVEEIVPCAPSECRCGKCGAATKVIGYETAEVLGMKPAEYFVRVVKREKRACAKCIAHGVRTAAATERIAPKSIFSDETIVEFIVRKYCDSVPLFRQRAILFRDLGIDVALTTIDDVVLRAGELLIPVVEVMKRDLLAGGYIQADETYCGVQTPEKKGSNHRAYFWQYSSPGKGVVFDFEMTRGKQVAREFFKDYGGILHTDGYVAYEKDIGTKDLIHACCLAHARRGFIDAIKVQTNAQAPDARLHPTDKDPSVGAPTLERAVALMDNLFAIDRQAREQGLSLADRHALRQDRAPALLDELHALLSAMKASGAHLPQSVAGKAINYTLKRWAELTLFLKHPVIELSTNWAENSMRPIAIGRRNWLHLGSKEAGPKIAAIFSIVESCRKLDVPIRKYLADVLPGLADCSIKQLARLTPAAYAANPAK